MVMCLRPIIISGQQRRQRVSNNGHGSAPDFSHSLEKRNLKVVMRFSQRKPKSVCYNIELVERAT